MIAILKRELYSYFSSMTGYIFVGLFVLMTAIFFSLINVLNLYPDYSVTLASTNILFLILIPALTMRLFAEEAKQKTDQLLFTSPLTINQIVFGKFFAALTLFLGTLLFTAIFPLVLSTFGTLPASKIVCVFIGFALLGCAFISVGLFISVLTDNQIIAAIATFCALFIFFVMDSISQAIPADSKTAFAFVFIIIACFIAFLYDNTKNIPIISITAVISLMAVIVLFVKKQELFNGLIVKVLNWFSVLSRFSNFSKGMLNIADIVYYVTFATFFIFLTTIVIEKRRYSS